MTVTCLNSNDVLGRYIGVPFLAKGRTEAGWDCWGLVCHFYAEHLGICLPEFGDISPRDLVRVAREMRDGAALSCWSEPKQPASGDVVLMRSARGGKAVCHVGLIADERRVLHVEEASGTVIVPIDHFAIRGRIAGFRRYVS